PALALATSDFSDALPGVDGAWPLTRACTCPARVGDSASLAWSAGVTSCGRGSPGRGGRSSALGGMVRGEWETILNSSGDTFLPPPRFSKALQPPSARAVSAIRAAGVKEVRRIMRGLF